jgi:iron(III) transport system ATP-binding protein
MTVLDVRNLTKKFENTTAVDNISFRVDAGEILVIVGASGCGKTTTLRCIAGLEEPTAGTISIGGKVVSSADVWLPPEKRGIGMVFQSYALWPHKTVAENVGYGLTRHGLSRAEIASKVDAMLKQVGLEGYQARYPSTLSGGQQQRVALARSAVLQPKLLLLDEPLSNLDAKLREQMRKELRDMIRMFNMTAIHITHDQSEAMALADRVICMRTGRIEQSGSPRDIYRRPISRFVADFIGACQFLDGVITSVDGAVQIADGLSIAVDMARGKMAGERCVLAVRPESVELSKGVATSGNSGEATILDQTFLGSRSEYLIDFAGIRLKADSALDFANGERCTAHIDSAGLILITR